MGLRKVLVYLKMASVERIFRESRSDEETGDEDDYESQPLLREQGVYLQVLANQ